MAITAFALFLSVSVWAQHGGGHAGGGGGHAGFGGGHAGGGFSGHSGFSGGHVGGGHVSGGVHSGSGYARSFAPGFSSRARQPFLHNGRNGSRFNSRSGNRDRYNRDRYRFYGLRNDYYGGRGWWGNGYPYWGWGGYPWDWWDSDNSYDNDYYQNLAAANEMNQQSLEEQRMFRQEQADGDQDAYAPPRRAPAADPPSSEKQGDPVLPPTVLVYRDQHKQEIQNYAIIGQTLWNFAPQHTQKIPLSDLDLTATVKVNEDQGVTFRVPSTNEAQ